MVDNLRRQAQIHPYSEDDFQATPDRRNPQIYKGVIRQTDTGFGLFVKDGDDYTEFNSIPDIKNPYLNDTLRNLTGKLIRFGYSKYSQIGQGYGEICTPKLIIEYTPENNKSKSITLSIPLE